MVAASSSYHNSDVSRGLSPCHNVSRGLSPCHTEETKKSFKDGFYHSGDLARKDANGNYVLLGRSGDMIKINGNRIEPAEIEAAISNALGIGWAAARGFNENGKSFLCAYYKENVHFDQDKLRDELMKRLPYYMIPSYFIITAVFLRKYRERYEYE